MKSRAAKSGIGRSRWMSYALIVYMGLTIPTLGLVSDRGGDEERWAILVVGAVGDPDLQQAYLKELEQLYYFLTRQLGFARERVRVLFENPAKNPAVIANKSTRGNLLEVCRSLASKVKDEDLIFVFIDGHGSYDGKTYKLNLVGPDPTAEDLAEMINLIPARRSVVVNATSSSGASLAGLSRKGRVVITATKSGMERNLTHAGKFFIEALTDAAADSDKDGRVSLMEAFLYLKQKVEEYYKNEGSLQTEHPVIDNNGDGEGHDQFSPDEGEGFLARATFLDKTRGLIEEGELDPDKQALIREARNLERQIEDLKAAKGDMPEAEYEKKLEELFLRLARINAKLRK